MKTALSLDAISEQLEAAGFACSARVVREAKRIIEKLKQEKLAMARNFSDAVKVVTDKVASLTSENADLKKQLETAIANARTTDEATAEQVVIDAAESILPSAPVAPPAV